MLMAVLRSDERLLDTQRTRRSFLVRQDGRNRRLGSRELEEREKLSNVSGHGATKSDLAHVFDAGTLIGLQPPEVGVRGTRSAFCSRCSVV